jgi:hypothetical protein
MNRPADWVEKRPPKCEPLFERPVLFVIYRADQERVVLRSLSLATS